MANLPTPAVQGKLLRGRNIFSQPRGRVAGTGGAGAVLLLALWLGGPADVQAQRGSVGSLTDATAVGALQQCPQPASARTDEGAIRIQRDALWSSVSVPTSVLTQDLLGVHQTLDARLRIDATAHGDGVLYLAPSLLCHPRIPADAVVSGLRLRQSPWAEYEVFTDTFTVDGRREERLAIAVERGALIVQWNPGPPLFVLAVGDTATIRGTTLAVAVDSAGSEGLIYLDDGSATLSRLPGGSMTAGQLLHLRRGLPPTTLSVGAGEGIRESVRYHGATVWESAGLLSRFRSFWSSGPRAKAALVGAGATAAYLVYRLVQDDYNPDENRHRGTVLLRIPI